MRENRFVQGILSEFGHWHEQIRHGAVPVWLGWLLTVVFASYVFGVLLARTNCIFTPPLFSGPLGVFCTLFIVLCLFNRYECLHGFLIKSQYKAWKVGVAIFCVQLMWLLYAQPFSMADVDYQLEQVDHFRFNDWHPLLHTWILWLLTRVCHSLWFLSIVQIVLFSFLCSRIYKNISDLGHCTTANNLLLLIAINPANFAFLRIPLKDVAFMLAVFAAYENLISFMCKHEFAMRFKNQFCFGFILFIASFVRHNGVLFSLPMALLLLISFKNRRMRLCALVVFAAFLFFSVSYIGVKMGLTRHGVYVTDRYSEGRASERYGESVGLIMTGLCSMYFTSYDNTPGDVKNLMESLGARPGQTYKGDYNSFKFKVFDRTGRTPASILAEKTTLPMLFSMLYESFKCDAYATLRAIRDTTSLVWDPFPIPKNSFNQDDWGLRDCWVVRILASTPFCYVFTSIGFWIAVVMALLVWGWIRKGSQALVYVLPILCYGFGSMLFLCGNDWRFFYAIVIGSPIAAVGVRMLPDNVSGA